MKKNSFRNRFIFLTGIILSLALSGCLNPFLQPDSEDTSQSAAVISATISPPPIETMAPLKNITVIFEGGAETLTVQIPIVPGYIDTFCGYYYDYYSSYGILPVFFKTFVSNEDYSTEYGKFDGGYPEEFTLVEEFIVMDIDVFYVYLKRKL